MLPTHQRRLPEDKDRSDSNSTGSSADNCCGEVLLGNAYDSGEDSDSTEEIQATTPPRSIVRIVALTVLWWSAAVYVTLLLKLTATSVDKNEPVLPPFMLTWLVNWATGFICFVLGKVFFQSGPLPQAMAVDRLKLLALGLVAGCEIGFLNKSLQYITISERTMIQNLNVLLMMISAQFFGLEQLTALRILAGLLLAGGGVLQGMVSSHGDSKSADVTPGHPIGILCMTASLLLTAVKWIMIQFILQRSDPKSYLGQMSKLQFASRMQPITGVVCLVLAFAFEKQALARPDILLSSEILLRVPALALGITVICCSELKLVQVTSAVATGVLMNLHHIPMVLAGVITFGEHVPLFSIYGFILNLGGGIIYSVARYRDTSE